MRKRIIAGTILGGLLAVSSVAATAAPYAFESVERRSAAVGSAEEVGGISNVALVAIFAAFAAGLILVIEDGEDAPTSP